MQTRDPEDELIRWLILLAATGTAIGLLVVATVITGAGKQEIIK